MDIVRVLPDMVANQIAAGEVIQRPASAVKELLENAIDAGADQITVVIKEAGKTLLQVSDNGCGMTENDAKLCFERHATSKIREANDLYAIRTMGFRGEALASIASIAQVELRTRRREDETGTRIIIEGTQLKSCEACQCEPGTAILVKNLFFNVPARRTFLKADSTEMKYIMEEFQHVALASPEVAFELFINGKQVYKLTAGNTRQRIIALFGDTYAQNLVPVETSTKLVNISGFIGKPEVARKTRGDQKFFANRRFIRHPYLHHAVMNAFQELLPDGTFPAYFLFLEVDPKTIDINIHPTKTEVKFEDEKSLYAILRSAVKQALGKFSLTPSLDFDIERSMDFPDIKEGEAIKVPQVKVDPYFNPFEPKSKQPIPSGSVRVPAQKGLDQWSKLYPNEETFQQPVPERSDELFPLATIHASLDNAPEPAFHSKYFQANGRFILTPIKSGLLIMNQQYLHERILFERIMKEQRSENRSSQQLLFPQTISFPPADGQLFGSILPEICHSGFDISDIGGGSFMVNGVPADFGDNNVQAILEELLESIKNNLNEVDGSKRVRVAAALAKQMAVKPGTFLSEDEMRSLVELLFSCDVPDKTPDGRKTFYTLKYDEIADKLR